LGCYSKTTPAPCQTASTISNISLRTYPPRAKEKS
jgi:hypothetical protein